MSTKENLTTALEVLRTKGWNKGVYRMQHLDGTACYCSMGALIAAARGDVPWVTGPHPDVTREADMLEKAIVKLGFADANECNDPQCDCTDSESAVIRFNDRSETEFSNVEAVFLKAIELAEVGETR